jgi:hypothetical protein
MVKGDFVVASALTTRSSKMYLTGARCTLREPTCCRQGFAYLSRADLGAIGADTRVSGYGYAFALVDAQLDVICRVHPQPELRPSALAVTFSPAQRSLASRLNACS